MCSQVRFIKDQFGLPNHRVFIFSAIEKIYPLVYEFRKPKEKSVNRRSNSGEGEEDFVEYGGAGTVRRGPLNYRSIHKGRGR